MKIVKPILGFAAFGLGLLIILYGLSFLFVPKNNTKDAGMEELSANGIQGEHPKSIDIVVVGNSETDTTISHIPIWENTR